MKNGYAGKVGNGANQVIKAPFTQQSGKGPKVKEGTDLRQSAGGKAKGGK